MVSSSLIERHLGQRRCLPMYHCTTYGGLRTRGERKEGGRRLPFHGEERERGAHILRERRPFVSAGGERGGDEIGHVRLAPVQNGGTRTVRRLAGGEKHAGEHNFIFPRQYADILDNY